MLDAAGVSHMLAGSFASAYHGIPRTTQDIDLVIDPSSEGALAGFVSKVSRAGYYVDAEHAREALRQRRQFNVIDAASGWKADLIIRKDRAFSLEEFRRRLPAKVLGVDLFVTTAEDVVLTKLEWAAKTDSDRQLADVEGVVRVKGANLDRAYMERWAKDLGVFDLWRRFSPGAAPNV
jgi:hypothetical protein